MAKSKIDRENGEWFLGFIWWAIFSFFYFSVVVFVSAPLLLEFIFCLRFASETKSSMFPSAIERRHREEILYISADIWLHCGCARVRLAVASGLAHRRFSFPLLSIFVVENENLAPVHFDAHRRFLVLRLRYDFAAYGMKTFDGFMHTVQLCMVHTNSINCKPAQNSPDMHRKCCSAGITTKTNDVLIRCCLHFEELRRHAMWSVRAVVLQADLQLDSICWCCCYYCCF